MCIIILVEWANEAWKFPVLRLVVGHFAIRHIAGPSAGRWEIVVLCMCVHFWASQKTDTMKVPWLTSEQRKNHIAENEIIFPHTSLMQFWSPIADLNVRETKRFAEFLLTFVARTLNYWCNAKWKIIFHLNFNTYVRVMYGVYICFACKNRIPSLWFSRSDIYSILFSARIACIFKRGSLTILLFSYW